MAEKRLGQQLTLSQAETTVRELEQALEKHRRGIKKFQENLVCRTAPRRQVLKSDSNTLTAFGKWYANTTNDYIRGHPGFADMGRHHRHMHTVAHKLAKLVKADKSISPKLYREFVVAVDKFKFSVRVVLLEARDMLRYTDSLTGLANRHMMKVQLNQEWERASRRDSLCSISMMDLDRFKLVNDTYGHAVGDVVLKIVARYMAAHLRRYDQVFRYGGEEFLILLPDTDPEQAGRALTRLRRGIAQQPIDVGHGKELTVTASFGVAALDCNLPPARSIEHADEALYIAKEAGRNRVHVYEPK